MSKRYGATRVLHDVSFAVREGELVAILGPSGSGKTTLLKIISGVERPDEGEVLISGRVSTGLEPQQRRVALVFQNALLFPHKTVKQNILFPLRMEGAPRRLRERQLGWGMNLIEMPLDEYGDRYPHQLSGGEAQRVALARGLVARPVALLLDEPLANLDRGLREKLGRAIRHYHRVTETPFVYVTHNQEEALGISDRLIVLNNGRVEQVGATQEVYWRPATPFVASFLAGSNRLQGEVMAVGRDGATVNWGGSPIEVPRVAGMKKGVAVQAFVRHDSLVLPDGNGTSPAFNRVEAAVTDVIFRGAVSEVLLQASNGEELVAAFDSRDLSFLTGENLSVAWPIDQTFAFLR